MEAFLTFLEEYPLLREFLTAVVLGLLSLVLYYISRKYIFRLIDYVLKQTKGMWYHHIIEGGALKFLPQFLTAVVLYQGAGLLPTFGDPLRVLITLWLFWLVIFALDRLLNGALTLYSTFPIAKKRPLKGYVQILKLILYLVAAIITISLLIGQSPWVFLSGLGAVTAILLLVFQDTILSFVASMQIMSHDLIRVGDWLEIPQYGADGAVIEIALHVVKVRNWDNTITTVPTYKLMKDSFKNWRGMSELGGRRIMRSVLIDQKSIKFCDHEMLEKFSQIKLLTEYIERKQKEITEHNQKHGFNNESLVNGRHLTNIGTLRAYIFEYLKAHPDIDKGKIVMVRQLQPTAEGLPIQIYAFASDIRWPNYEGIQADIFDHILAIIPEFKLRVYQKPSGHDFASLALPQTNE